MKRIIPLLMVLLLFPTLALGEDLSQSPTANAVVEAAQPLYVTAPFSGTLAVFDWMAGDQLAQGETLFAYDTTKVYAPFDGTLAALYVEKGGDASAAVNRYGMAAAIEPANPYLIHATTASAYDKSENKFIHVGETLYYKSSDNARIKGTGRVISVTSTGYTVEVLTGEPEIDETVNLYRDSDYIKESAVGKGACAAAQPIPVSAGGRVVKMNMAEGRKVKAGDLLMETLSQDAAPDTSGLIASPSAAVLVSLACGPGQQVYKGQLLATLCDPAGLILAAQVDEVDVGSLSLGSQVSVVLDSQPGVTYQSTVTAIAQSGTQRQNACYYRVELALPQISGLRLGMNATVYLTK